MPVGNCWNKIGMHENNYVFKKQTLSLPPPLSFSHEYTINNFFHFSIVLINNTCSLKSQKSQNIYRYLWLKKDKAYFEL